MKWNFLFWLLTIGGTSSFVVKVVYQLLKNLNQKIQVLKLIDLSAPNLDLRTLLATIQTDVSAISKKIESVNSHYERRKKANLELKSASRTLKTLPMKEKKAKIPKIKRNNK